MTPEKIIQDWKQKKFKPVYWLEGEEDYFIDQVVSYAEHHLLPESEAGFNLSVFYGKDAQWPEVVNACRRYPMFAERQVVILKEAQQMKDLDKLESYIENPLASTLLLVAHKEKKVDGRGKLAKLLKEKAELVQTKKLWDSQLPEWTGELIRSKGLTITQKALQLLVEHIGNDLSRIHNEIEKIRVSLEKRTGITEDDIEEFIGVSKEYNVFEFQKAIARKDLGRCLQIIQYFESNPKAAPIQLILPTLYGFFSKLYIVHSLPVRDKRSITAAAGVNPAFADDYLRASTVFSPLQVEKVILLLEQYNLKSVGVGDAGTEDASLLKEMTVKMMM